MPVVTVELYGVPRLRAGTARVAVEGGNLGEVLRAVGRELASLQGSVIGPGGEVAPHYRVSLNGERFVSDPATSLSEGDILLLLGADLGG